MYMSYLEHPSAKMVQKVKQLYLPLSERYNINGFCYDMSFRGGELSLLTDNIQNFESLYSREYTPICSNASGRTVDTGVYTLQLLCKNSVDEDFFTKKFESLYETNQIIHMINRGKAFDEMFTFTFSMHNNEFEYFILNNLAQLKGFIHYFKESMKNEIALVQRKENRIHFPNLLEGSAHDMPLHTHDNTSELCILLENGQSIFLTAQQSACLKLLINDKSVKQIAAELFLSPRTVEHYLIAVRRKLSCRSLLTLISKYGDQIR